jgi:hypothetical protein
VVQAVNPGQSLIMRLRQIMTLRAGVADAGQLGRDEVAGLVHGEVLNELAVSDERRHGFD